MNMEGLNFSVIDLERRTYRYLQQVAKSLSLPSNVKKVHLIHLIHAKKFKTEDEVNSIIQQVKLERQQQAQSRKKNRKKNLQNREISSSSVCQSPPITRTPKRPIHAVLRYSPEYNNTFIKCNSRHTIFSNSKLATRSISNSDRVLRSFNHKTLAKSYGTVNLCNDQPDMFKPRNELYSPKRATVNIVNQGGRLSSFNVPSNCVERRHRPSILSGNSCLTMRNENQKRLVIANHRGIAASLPKRQRTVSGIYPIIPHEVQNQHFDHIQELKLRHTDGRLSTINALVKKRNIIETAKVALQNRNELNIQDLLNSVEVSLNDCREHTNNNYLQTSLGASSYVDSTNRESLTSTAISETFKESVREAEISMYYHKKIRSEQVRYRRMTCRDVEDDRLPKITDVFSRFNSVSDKDVTQPLYVQVTELPDTHSSYTWFPSRNIPNTCMLEGLYNFKNTLLVNAPLMHIVTIANTKSVYSTPVIATPMAQHTVTLDPVEPFAVTNKSTSASSLDTSQSQMGECTTIPEMVEDALEIISQDGDYMEQIGMDLRVQCVLCSWAGPKIILEFHIRKEHETQIHQLRGSESDVAYALGGLVECRLWLSRVLEHDAVLYVLSAKYEGPDCLMATLSSLCSEPDPMDKEGSITIYNRVTGEPYTWKGVIQPLPANLPYENDVRCLNIELSKLDLLPNSANLKLHNEELILKSPSNVVVGQPEFNDIQIKMFIRIS